MTSPIDADFFQFIGYRITKLEIDESSLGDSAEPITAEVTATFSAPMLGGERNGNSVLEMSLQLDVMVKPEDSAAHASPALSTQLVAGLSFNGEFDEKAKHVFEQEKNFYARSLYWLLRDQCMNATRPTKLRALPLPWDIRELGWPSRNDTEPSKAKPAATKSAKKPATRAKK